MKPGKPEKLRGRPCPTGTPPLPRTQARKRLARLAGWKLTAKGKSISKLYIMRDFSAAIAIMETIHPIAQAEDHHPDLHLTNYRRLRIVLSTHKVGGLSDKDFILAAKIEALPKALKAR